jgi:LysR family hydrogen peroxide-inducible transcriptional activator
VLADHGHFGRAAKANHVTQSTLSASIKELEKILQASLVDRTKRRVLLTPLGLDIVERARRILLEGKELATVGPFLLPQIFSPRLRRVYPALRLYLDVGGKRLRGIGRARLLRLR